MAAITQTIAIVDKSNKVVSTSKQLKNVFKEAKMAYLERKAEITADRRQKEERELHKAIKAMSVAEETESNASSRPHSRRHHSHRSQRDRSHHATRPALQEHRHPSSQSVHSGRSSRSSLTESPRSSRSPYPLGRSDDDLAHTRSAPTSPLHSRKKSLDLVRRATDLPLTQQTQPRPLQRSYSSADIDDAVDMDLAYGDFHPEHDSLALRPDVEEKLQKQELASLVTKCKMLLDEANCAQHSVKAIVAHLQKNPDAMAAVALTLAEISNIVTKMAPGALMAFKSSAPAVFSLLAAPQFLIAVGVGVGLTVVMFGGYKIVKKIQANRKEKEEGMDEMLDVEELSRIEVWRRGIADTDNDGSSVVSGATSVEGEFITPAAARSLGHLPLDEKSRRSKKDKEGKEKKQKKHKSKSKGGSEVGSEASKSSSRRSSSSRSKDKDKDSLSVPGSRSEIGSLKDRALIKVKKPSPLRRMFRSGETNSVAS